MKKVIRPVGTRLLIDPVELKDTTKAGIIIAGGNKAEYFEGKVLAAGTNTTLVKVGEHVAFLKYGYDEMEVDGKKFYLVEESSVIAVYEETNKS